MKRMLLTGHRFSENLDSKEQKLVDGMLPIQRLLRKPVSAERRRQQSEGDLEDIAFLKLSIYFSISRLICYGFIARLGFCLNEQISPTAPLA
jgi:hypothetical protein